MKKRELIKYLKDYENSMSQIEGETLRFTNLW